jgi:probable F420-dependent oxidoreductase
LYDYPASDVIPLARAAEAAGFDGVWLGEHYVCPKEFTSEHPSANPADEHPAARIVGPDVTLHDPWCFLGAVAGATSRLKIGTAISIVPLNHPLVLARSVLTAQEISGGRLLFGTGAGWLREEFDVLNIPFETRASRYDEMLDIMRQAWTGGYFQHAGTHFSFAAVQLTPHRVDIPLVIGGNSERALRRVARKADGWLNSAMIELADAERLRDRIQVLRREYGTDQRPFSFHVRPPRTTLDEIERFVAAGFHDIVLWGPQVWPNDAAAPLEDKQAHLRRVAGDLGVVCETPH